MKEETRNALEAELSRCDAIRREFLPDEMFVLYAIVQGWSVERAFNEYQKRVNSTRNPFIAKNRNAG